MALCWPGWSSALHSVLGCWEHVFLLLGARLSAGVKCVLAVLAFAWLLLGTDLLLAALPYQHKPQRMV
jgi:hypothetical protein